MAFPTDTELHSQTLKIEQKLFYFDLKENRNGRYLKISEKAPGGRSTLIVPSAGIYHFAELLRYYTYPPEQEILSKEIQFETKTFTFDIGDNPRGRFLKVVETVGRNRSTIIVPSAIDSNGWIEFGKVLQDMWNQVQMMQPLDGEKIENYMEENQMVDPGLQRHGGVIGSLVPSQADQSQNNSGDGQKLSKMIVRDNKKFYIDLDQNSRGKFLKISEVVNGDRSSVIVPAAALEEFYEALGEIIRTGTNQ